MERFSIKRDRRMKLFVIGLLMVVVLALGTSSYLPAQAPAVDHFFEGLSAHPADEQVEGDQTVYQELNSASPPEVVRVLPSLMKYARVGNPIRTRAYAVLFLSAIAIRADGAELLYSRSGEISSLIVDADPGIQKAALAVTDYVIARPATNSQPYVAALKAGIQNSQTPQDVLLAMVSLFLQFHSSDAAALKSVVAFMNRGDLTAETHRQLLNLGLVPGLPEEVNRALSRDLDNPDPAIRVAALVVFADSTTAFHTLSKGRVARMANDPHGIKPKRRRRMQFTRKANAAPHHLAAKLRQECNSSDSETKANEILKQSSRKIPSNCFGGGTSSFGPDESSSHCTDRTNDQTTKPLMIAGSYGCSTE